MAAPAAEVRGEMRTGEGFVPIGRHKTWYQRVGGEHASLAPILMLHGGPGAPHDYLENLSGLASPERAVIFYDQLGCGRSDHPDDPALCQIRCFVDELAQVR